MGKEIPEQEKVAISGIDRSGLLLHIYNYYKKWDRLCFDHTGKISHQFTIPSDHPDPVKLILEKIEKKALCLKNHYNLKLDEIKSKMEPDQIYLEVFTQNRILNRILDIPFNPTLVYSNLKKIYDLLLNSKKYLKFDVPKNEPDFIDGKRPKDVYKKLDIINKKILTLAQSFQINIANLDISNQKDIRPADVYDFSQHILSNIYIILKARPATFIDQRAKLNIVERKFPSDVYHLATKIEEIVDLIIEGHNEQD